jgi:hypothetical protein
MRGRRGFRDLPAAAEAFVGPLGQREHRLLVCSQPMGLHHRLAVEGDSQGDEVGTLLVGHSRSDARHIEVLDPEQESTTSGSRKKPGKQRSPQVSYVQLTRRTGRIAARAGAAPRRGEVISRSAREGGRNVKHLLVPCSSRLR